MPDIQEIAKTFGDILGVEAEVEDGMCEAEKERDLDVTVQGRPFKSELSMEIHFESLEEDGTALNHAEIVVLPEEIPEFTRTLGKNDLTITALHNHWLFAEPNIKYLHVQSVEKPEIFAQKLSNAISVLKD
ncbi:DUF1259 domain-containing protein [Sediminibacillus halophilus]|uniref:DUF1259 domain-containing protein n=1 Tax=Sediminibacillus halophilus TaxID=482461 RepID=A0A1G9NTN5_9BACI|nr:DUF1259 domain-containing protein [Sediminibacillus halophilus]SDL89673.1 protein of unknown function [Sediminibacillus halophilus]